MRKNVLFLLAIAFAATTFITSCGKEEKGIKCPDTTPEREALYIGDYSGEAILNVVVLGSPVSVPVAGTFKVNGGLANDDNKLVITSNLLESNVFGIDATVSESNCTNVTINRITKDTLEFTNMPASLAGSLITNYRPLKIIDFSAEGTGVLQNDGKTLKMTLKILSGTTSSPNGTLNGLNVANNTLELKVVKTN